MTLSELIAAYRQAPAAEVLPLLNGYFRANPTPFTGGDQHSRVLDFRRTAIMDTITAILAGQVTALSTDQPLPATVRLATTTTTFTTVAASSGTFQFLHIPAGDYLLTATSTACTKLSGTPVHLGTGDAVAITIGLGCQVAAMKY